MALNLKALTSLALAALSLVPAAAQEHRYGPPPAEYARFPSPPPIIRYVEDADSECRKNAALRKPKGPIYACSGIVQTGPLAGRCVVVIGTRSPIPLDTLRRHEYAHCNGWKHPF